MREAARTLPNWNAFVDLRFATMTEAASYQ